MTFRIDPETLRGRRAIENAAILAHEANRYYCAAIGDMSQPHWKDAPEWQQSSAIAGVQQILKDPDTTPEQSHEGWTKQKLKEGWVYGPEKDPEKKTHHCLVPYKDLPLPQRYKDAIFGKVVRTALWCYEDRPFVLEASHLPACEMPFRAIPKIKQTGMVIAFGKANRLATSAMMAYLQATGYPAPDFPDEDTRMDVGERLAHMVLCAIISTSPENAYNCWRAANLPAIHPDLDDTVSQVSPPLVSDLTRVQWFLVYGIAQAVAWIEGIMHERDAPKAWHASSRVATWSRVFQQAADDIQEAAVDDLRKAGDRIFSDMIEVAVKGSEPSEP